MLLEVIVRYATLYTMEAGFTEQIIAVFYSDKAMLSNEP